MTPDRFARLPGEMRSASRWLLWKSVPQGEGKKPRKVPYYADGTARSGKLDTPEDRAKLAPFEDAVAALSLGGCTDLGFALGPDGSGRFWQGIDLDDIPQRPALKEVGPLPGFVEMSPSGKGVHAIGYGRRFDALGSNASGIEAYSSGRFFTVTGKCRVTSAPVDIADFVDAVLRPRHSPNKAAGAPPATAAAVLPNDPLRAASPDLIADLRSALATLPADDRHDWIRFGHALKTIGEPGRNLWIEWSSKSEAYNPDGAEEQWSGFKPDHTGYAAIFAEAQRRGWRNPAVRDDDGQGVSGGLRTEIGLADAFARENQGGLQYCAKWDQWFIWDSVRWARDETLRATDDVVDLCNRVAAASTDPREARVLGAWRTVSAVKSLARADRRLAATTEQWDADPWLLNTPGGVVDLRTGEVRPCGPAYNMTKVTGAAPGQEGAPPVAWLKFLDRITGGDTELQAHLQRVLGYALTGDTSEHTLFFAYGTGANGKSVSLNTVAGIMGDYHTTAPIETFTDGGGERHSTELAMLRGARLVTASETEEGRPWKESRVKSLTGGDPVTARFMHRDNFTFTPQLKLFVAGNHRPVLHSVDEAIRRRLNLIPFAVTIPPEERDEGLMDKLRAEWPGILAWMIAGCLEWQRIGLAPPAAVTAATDAYLAEEDLTAAWIDEACERDPQAWEASADLFTSWRVWAERRGARIGDNKRLVQVLEGRGFCRRAKAHARGVDGLRLKALDFP